MEAERGCWRSRHLEETGRRHGGLCRLVDGEKAPREPLRGPLSCCCCCLTLLHDGRPGAFPSTPTSGPASAPVLGGGGADHGPSPSAHRRGAPRYGTLVGSVRVCVPTRHEASPVRRIDMRPLRQGGERASRTRRGCSPGRRMTNRRVTPGSPPCACSGGLGGRRFALRPSGYRKPCHGRAGDERATRGTTARSYVLGSLFPHSVASARIPRGLLSRESKG